jgi:hypothetical protein
MFLDALFMRLYGRYRGANRIASSSLVTRSSLDGATRAARKLFERLERSSNALRASASPKRSQLGMVRLWRTISSPAPIIAY